MSYIQILRWILRPFPGRPLNRQQDFIISTPIPSSSNYNLPGSGANKLAGGIREGPRTGGFSNVPSSASFRWTSQPAMIPTLIRLSSPLSARADGRTAGKIVDLDPEQQMVSEIWGSSIVLGGGSGVEFLRRFLVAAFGDIWVRYAQGQPDFSSGRFIKACWKSLDWRSETGVAMSEELDELLPGSKGERKLSIKFNVDGFQDDLRVCRCLPSVASGSIGLHSPEEPVHFLAARALTPTPGRA